MSAEYVPLATKWIRLHCSCGENVQYSSRWQQANIFKDAFISEHCGRGHKVTETVDDEVLCE